MSSPKLQTGKSPNRSSVSGPLGRTVLEPDFIKDFPTRSPGENIPQPPLAIQEYIFPAPFQNLAFFWLVFPAAATQCFLWQGYKAAGPLWATQLTKH